MNGHPQDQAKVSVHCRWPLIRGNLTLKCVGRGIDNVAVQGRWPLTTGVAQGRYYCTILLGKFQVIQDFGGARQSNRILKVIIMFFFVTMGSKRQH